MTQQIIGLGASGDDGLGDDLRTGGDKINDNFTEVYSMLDDTCQALSRIPEQGQSLAENSIPVVLPVSQIEALTPPAAITGFATEVTLNDVLLKLFDVVDAIAGLQFPDPITGYATEFTLGDIQTQMYILEEAINSLATEGTLERVKDSLRNIEAIDFATATKQGDGSQKTMVVPSGTLADYPSVYSSSAYEAGHVVKAAPGVLLSIIGYNSLASDQWIQVHNSSGLINTGAVPIASFKVSALDNFFLTLSIPCSTGIIVCNSTTGPTMTAGAANCFFTVQYK